MQWQGMELSPYMPDINWDIFIIIIVAIMAAVGIFYLITFLIYPMLGVKKKQAPEVSRIPLPELNERAKLIVEYALTYFYKKEKIDLRKEPLAIRRLYDAALEAEKELKRSESTLIRLRHMVTDDWGSLNLELRIYRELFEKKKK